MYMKYCNIFLLLQYYFDIIICDNKLFGPEDKSLDVCAAVKKVKLLALMVLSLFLSEKQCKQKKDC